MIAITNDQGMHLLLPADQRLTLERSAGWLQDDVLPGAKSYPIEFPIKPNEAFLQSGYRPDAGRPRMEFPVTVRLAGVIYRRCLLNYRITEGKGSGYLKIDGGEVFGKLKKLTLQDALPDEIVLTAFFLDPLLLKLRTIAALPPGQFPLTFFPIRNQGFFESDVAGKVPGFVAQSYVNAWGQLPGNGGYGFLMDSDTVKGYPISPQFYLSWVLERLFALVNYRISGDWIATDAVQRLVILNQTAMSSKSPGLLSQAVSSVIAGQHLPKLSVGDFLKAIRQRFALIYDFDGDLQTVTIRQFNDVVRTPARDLTPYIAGRYGIDAPDNKGFSLTDGVDPADELYKDAEGNAIPQPSYVVGGPNGSPEPETIPMSVCGTQMIYEPSGMGGGKWMVPTLLQAGNILDVAYKESDRYPNKVKAGQALSLKNDTALRLVSYMGMVESSNGLRYPLATTDGRDGRQAVISTNSVNLSGRNGLFRTSLRAFYYFRDQTRPLTIPLNLPVSVAAGLKLHEPIALTLENQANRTYLLEKIQAESPGPGGMMPCKLYALSLPDGLDLPFDIDEPLVWVELKQVQSYSSHVGPGGIIYVSDSVALTLLCWQDAQRTQPAVVTNLPVTLREKKTWKGQPVAYEQPQKLYEERQLSYLLNGSSTLIESAFITHYSESPGGNYRVFWDRSVQLDPGEGYNILSV